ncbi:MAG: BACON domain-containing protein [Dysgonamonadaceae bacterium]|nr:BACON domain-containing protein [Dysgonamonadaceae bacterium]
MQMAAVAMVMIFSSCNGEEPTPAPEADLKVSVETLEFTDAGGKQNFTVESPNNWTVKSDQTFVTVSPAGGKATTEPEKITVTVAVNNETEARTATITITSGSKTKKVTLTQSGSTLASTDSHDVTFSASKTAYLNKATFEDQMVSTGEDGFIPFCVPVEKQLVYNVTIMEEGDLKIALLDDYCEIYVATSAANAAACTWVRKQTNELDKPTVVDVHLLPQKNNVPYLVIICPYKEEFDAATYEYSVRMDFTPRVIDVPVPENGIKVAGAIWSKSNSIYKDGKVAFADTPDTGDALWQYDQPKPAAADNWYDPSFERYVDRTNETLANAANIPCPKGWTLPTNAQTTALINSGYTPVVKGAKGATNNGGIFFGENSDAATISDPKGCLFLPFVGYIDGNNGSGYETMPERQGTGADGAPLQSHYTMKDIQYSDGPYFLVIASAEVDIKGEQKEVGITEGWSRPWRAQAVRCVLIEE